VLNDFEHILARYSAHRVVKKLSHILYALIHKLKLHQITTDPFSNICHCRNLENILDNTVNKNPTTSQVCRYTTL